MGISALSHAILLPFKRHSFTNLLVYVHTMGLPSSLGANQREDICGHFSDQANTRDDASK
jgi:hypothetical protein